MFLRAVVPNLPFALSLSAADTARAGGGCCCSTCTRATRRTCGSTSRTERGRGERTLNPLPARVLMPSESNPPEALRLFRRWSVVLGFCFVNRKIT